jgi:hypothetical protein
MFPYKHIGTWNIFSYWINCTTLVGRLYRECSMEKLMEFLDAMERRDALKLIDSLCWLSSIFDVTAIVHLSHYTDALKLTIVFCLYVISPFRLLKNDSRKLSYFVLSFPFPKIWPVSYTDLLIHYLFFSNKDLHPPCSISGNFKDLWSKCYLKASWEHHLAERLKIDK